MSSEIHKASTPGITTTGNEYVSFIYGWPLTTEYSASQPFIRADYSQTSTDFKGNYIRISKQSRPLVWPRPGGGST